MLQKLAWPATAIAILVAVLWQQVDSRNILQCACIPTILDEEQLASYSLVNKLSTAQYRLTRYHRFFS